MPTLKSKKRLENLKKEISEFLHEGICPIIGNSKPFVQYYWDASQKAEELILVALGEEGMRFPVDVVSLAEKLGVVVEEENLNEFVNKKVSIRRLVRL